MRQSLSCVPPNRPRRLWSTTRARGTLPALGVYEDHSDLRATAVRQLLKDGPRLSFESRHPAAIAFAAYRAIHERLEVRLSMHRRRVTVRREHLYLVIHDIVPVPTCINVFFSARPRLPASAPMIGAVIPRRSEE